MQINSLKFFSDYKQFEKNQIITFSDPQQDTTDYLNINMSIVVGRNGSGKTTLMSLIVMFFYHLERYNGKIAADFELKYSIKLFKNYKHITFTHINNLVRVSINGVYENVQLLPRKTPHAFDNKIVNMKEKYITYDNISQYCPTTVVTSVFSIHGEYPGPRPRNFNGVELVSNRSITNIYGNNHYKLGSISRGIIRFIRLYVKQSSKLRKLMGLFDLKFTSRVQTKAAENDARWESVDLDWLKQKEASVQLEEIYLNDLEFSRDGRTICLGNMSSGEKMLLLRTISILDEIEKNSIVIIEEPELHLDQVWNRQLTTLFSELYSDYRAHLIIATHDYSIINSVPGSNLIFLQLGKEKKIDRTFLASYNDLFDTLYGDKFRPNKIEEGFLDGMAAKKLAELKADFSEMGNSAYKFLVFKRIKELENVEG